MQVEPTTLSKHAMKPILPFPMPVALLLLLATLATTTTASAQSPIARSPVFDPASGLPVTPKPLITSERPQAIRPLPTAPDIDPTTGLPLQPAPQWIDPNWSDPDIVLTNVMYDDLPLSEVARDLRARFKGEFDILPMPQTYGTDWGSKSIRLQLKDVRASDVFNAMNLVFENDQTPLRWELKAGTRPLVLLRVLPEAAPEPQPPAKPVETHRQVFFIGNLIGDEKSGGMTMDQIIQTITQIWPKDFGNPDRAIQFHTDTQLLVVKGTPDQLEFVQQTLAALEQKVQAARPKSAQAKDVEELVNLIKSLKSIGDSSDSSK